MAALTSYRLKDRERTRRGRRSGCRRIVPDGPQPGRGGAPLDTPVSTLPGVGERTAERLDVARPRDVRRSHRPSAAHLHRPPRHAHDRATSSSGRKRRSSRRSKRRRSTASAGNRTRIDRHDLRRHRLHRLHVVEPGLARANADGGNRGRVQREGEDVPRQAADGLTGLRPAPSVGRVACTRDASSPSIRRPSACRRRSCGACSTPRSSGSGDSPIRSRAQVRAERNLLGKDVATRLVHFPEDLAQIDDARRRLVFEELFVLQIGLALRKRHLEEDVRGIAHDADRRAGERVRRRRCRSRPTKAQDARDAGDRRRTWRKPRPMHRLLQGDVGMREDARRRSRGDGRRPIGDAGRDHGADRGARRAARAQDPRAVRARRRQRRAADERGAAGASARHPDAPGRRRPEADLRDARADLRGRRRSSASVSPSSTSSTASVSASGCCCARRARIPDVLIMTATPIPRTLALTLYGDLDVSILDELPAGRQPVKTVVVGDDAAARNARTTSSGARSPKGRRAFVVCALVDESDSLEAKAAVAEAERLRTEVFPDLEVGLLHGQMKNSREGRRDGRVPARRHLRPHRDDRGRGRRRRPGGDGDADRERRALRPLAAAPAPRPHRPRRARRDLHPVLATRRPKKRKRGSRRSRTRTTGSSSPRRTCASAAKGTIFGTRQAGLTDLKVARLVEDFPVVVEAREAAFALVDDRPEARPARARPAADEVGRRFGDSLDGSFTVDEDLGRATRGGSGSRSRRAIRPASEKVRQAIFASIAAHVPDARVLDLFAVPARTGSRRSRAARPRPCSSTKRRDAVDRRPREREGRRPRDEREDPPGAGRRGTSAVRRPRTARSISSSSIRPTTSRSKASSSRCGHTSRRAAGWSSRRRSRRTGLRRSGGLVVEADRRYGDTRVLVLYTEGRPRDEKGRLSGVVRPDHERAPRRDRARREAVRRARRSCVRGPVEPGQAARCSRSTSGSS